MIDEEDLFNQPIKNNLKTYDNMRRIVTGQGDDYTTGCLIDYPYFKEYFNLISIDFSKQKAFNDDPEAIQEINFIGNLERDGNTKIFSTNEEAKENVLDVSQGTVKLL